MNPWAVILLLIAIGCLIVAYEGSQDNVFSAITGKKVGSPNISGTAQGSTSILGIIPTANITNTGNAATSLPTVTA
jgi:hypothetical protein